MNDFWKFENYLRIILKNEGKCYWKGINVYIKHFYRVQCGLFVNMQVECAKKIYCFIMMFKIWRLHAAWTHTHTHINPKPWMYNTHTYIYIHIFVRFRISYATCERSQNGHGR